MEPLFNCGVYRWLNTVTGKSYIGSAVNLRIRKNTHLSLLRNGKHHSPKLQCSWNKHGPKAFEFEVLAYCSKEDLLWLEQLAIDAFNSAKIGYNIAAYTTATRLGSVVSRCEPYRDVIKPLAMQGLSAVEINRILVADHGFEGNERSVLYYVRRFRGFQWKREEQIQALADYTKNPKHCAVCGVSIPHKKGEGLSATRKRKYCSPKCSIAVNQKTTQSEQARQKREASRRRAPIVDRICPVCSIVFQVPDKARYKSKKCCSQRCAAYLTWQVRKKERATSAAA